MKMKRKNKNKVYHGLNEAGGKKINHLRYKPFF